LISVHQFKNFHLKVAFLLWVTIRISFKLCNVSMTFQWLMNHVLHDYLGKFVIVYFNDVIIYSKSIAEHIKHLDWILSQLKWIELKIKMEKCEFAKLEIKLLGHWILVERIIPDSGKVTAIKVLEWPTTISKFRGFLKIVSFFRKYIQEFKQIAKPLNNMISIKFRNC